MKIGILALQGAFREHLNSFKACGVDAIEIRYPEQLQLINALVIPGGESTVMSKLLKVTGLEEGVKDFSSQGGPIWGTCAGAILLSCNKPDEEVDPLCLIQIEIERNSYGRQAESFETSIPFNGWEKPFPAVFIRAPRVTRWDDRITVGAVFNESPVAFWQGNAFATTFHPELTEDLRIHQFFLEKFL